MYKFLLDSSCLIAFIEELNRPDLLKKLQNKSVTLLITNFVKRELEKGNTYKKISENKIKLEIVSIDVKTVDEFITRVAKSIGKGEASVIVYTLMNLDEEIIPILDDKRARQIASKYGIHYHGTIWIIQEILPSLNIISRAESRYLIKILKKSGFYISI